MMKMKMNGVNFGKGGLIRGGDLEAHPWMNMEKKMMMMMEEKLNV